MITFDSLLRAKPDKPTNKYAYFAIRTLALILLLAAATVVMSGYAAQNSVPPHEVGRWISYLFFFLILPVYTKPIGFLLKCAYSLAAIIGYLVTANIIAFVMSYVGLPTLAMAGDLVCFVLAWRWLFKRLRAARLRLEQTPHG